MNEEGFFYPAAENICLDILLFFIIFNSTLMFDSVKKIKKAGKQALETYVDIFLVRFLAGL